MTKKQAYEHYKKLYNFEGASIEECYIKPSNRKRDIYISCVRRAVDSDASLWGITGYNSQKFTFSFIYNYLGIEWIEIDTGYYIRTYKVEDLKGLQ